jgi:antagonist of KipI
MSIHVIEPGLFTLVVDEGRPGSRSLGVPVGGAADRTALAIGNALVGSPPSAAALEINYAGPVLEADTECASVLWGAPFEMSSNVQKLHAGRTFTFRPGEQIRIGGTRTGARAYLCVHGGFDVPMILGSRSGLEPLVRDRVLECPTSSTSSWFIVPEWNWNQEPLAIRTVPGPQADWFRSEEFYGQEYAVTSAANRMGIRLAARPLTLPQRELVSEPVCPGAVQVTRDGQCVTLGVDGQTIGGYPKIAHVIAADIDKLAQLRPDNRIRFAPVNLDEAERIYHRKQQEVQEWLVRLRVALRRDS